MRTIKIYLEKYRTSVWTKKQHRRKGIHLPHPVPTATAASPSSSFFPLLPLPPAPPPAPGPFPPALLFFASSSLFSLYLQPDLGSVIGEVTGIALLGPFCVFFRPRRGLVTWIHVGNICQLPKDEQSIPAGDREECPCIKGTSFSFSSSLTLTASCSLNRHVRKFQKR